jgi:superfamily I DNA/RNA helicase
VVESISKRVLELIEQLIQRNEANLAAFVEAVQTLLDKKQFGEEDAPYVPEGRVVIMTQHQAKGLEFPAVAIPGGTSGNAVPRVAKWPKTRRPSVRKRNAVSSMLR